MLLKKATETTKYILENLHDPERLENHPWVMSAFTKEYLSRHPEARELSPGRQLAAAFANLFMESMPASPPRQGKRLDTRWGEYGLLAAQYIIPFLTGTTKPRSLKEAWTQIDQAITTLAGRQHNLDDETSARDYKLIGNEPEAANSTLSDWNRKGIEHFAEFIELREKHIEVEAVKKARQNTTATPKPQRNYRPILWGLLGVLLLSLLALGTWGYLKAQRMMALADALRQEMQTVQKLELSLDTLNERETIAQSLNTLDTNLRLLDEEARPYLWLTPYLGWVPTYGGDIQNSPALLDLALALNTSLQESYQSLSPLADLISQEQSPTLDALIAQIKQSQPGLQRAQQALEQAKVQRANIKSQQLSPQIRPIIEDRIDPAMTQLDQGLSITLAAPGLLGAGDEGLRTYMLVLQNEDEIRATGGFLTSVGTIVVQDGKILNMIFEDSYDLDDLSKPYPAPPWQLEEYMDAPIWLLRDSNWSPDFLITTGWVEYLYAYTRGHSVDGIIGITQHTLVRLLETTGPMQVEGYDMPISAENVLQAMRESKIPPEDTNRAEWDRKEFIGVLGPQLMDELMAGQRFSWQEMLKTLTALLDEKHILLQFDDPVIARLLAEQGWDGQVKPPQGDFLMVVDSNIGFSKNSQIVERKFDIEIDLRDLDNLHKHINIEYYNPIKSEQDCSDPRVPEEERWYPVTRCYGNYLRLYTPQGSLLNDSRVHPVPAEWTLRNRPVPARVDVLENDLQDFSVFGTYFVVPFETRLTSVFKFDTPASVLEQKIDGSIRYTLKIQKQSGIIELPITLRLIFPEGSDIIKASGTLKQDGSLLTGQLRLREDIHIEVIWLPPDR
jgi:hypothetical protein